jgi:hypothetical protein
MNADKVGGFFGSFFILRQGTPQAELLAEATAATGRSRWTQMTTDERR